MFQPFQRLAQAELPDLHDQIDGTTPTQAQVPVHELGTAHRTPRAVCHLAESWGSRAASKAAKTAGRGRASK